MAVDTNLTQPFSNLQLELLKLYASHVSEEDLLQIRDLLARFFFERAKDAADQAWDEKQLSEETLLNKHRRSNYQVTQE